jgi:hypothetical protein
MRPLARSGELGARRAADDLGEQERDTGRLGPGQRSIAGAAASIATQAWVRGPDDSLDLGEGEVAFPYYVANEGSGIALNVRHGVEVDGNDEEFGEGMEFRSLKPGENAPIRDPVSGKLLQIRPLAVVKPERGLGTDWQTRPRRYWARFENVFGEQFETRNPFDPQQSATLTLLRGP